MYRLLHSLLALFALAGQTLADCISFGYDFVDGGGPYCINTTSTDYFSFGTEFEGCQPSDSQGDITPILVDPNNNEYFCSNIPTQPADTDMVSTCNVTGNTLQKDQMFSGNWTVVVEGLTFAWQRDFSVIAAPPVTVTSTPTATFTVTNIPSTTITSTSTGWDSITISASTITLPSTTLTRTITTTPSRVTVYSTSTVSRTRTARSFSSTISTTTVTANCMTQPHRQDPTCTIHPTKASLLAAASSAVSSIVANTTVAADRWSWRGPSRYRHVREVSKRARIEPRDGQLVKRGADVCTTTYLETTAVVSSTVTVTGPTSTETDTRIVSSTTTITPPPVTAYSGQAHTTTTVTAATPTRTQITKAYTTVWTTKTIVATITSTVKTTPSGMVCATAPGRFF
ncbi:hypothetical protein PV11_08538 [Exophiala sideris]|uniref:Ig-like domain-containing protein n=1 Tax=Exophiala sideris TaxID=1016849 RepID=A0A0D1Z2K3_9EURO|nr:hypothetical protein PV11_08538 [Exophiala sideris]